MYKEELSELCWNDGVVAPQTTDYNKDSKSNTRLSRFKSTSEQ